jgi:hypothetical protein
MFSFSWRMFPFSRPLSKTALMYDNTYINIRKVENKMIKAIENFMDTYGKYMAAATWALKPCSQSELEYMVKMFRNDSQR